MVFKIVIFIILKFLILNKRELALLNFNAVSLMWSFQFRFWSVLIPRYVTDSEG